MYVCVCVCVHACVCVGVCVRVCVQLQGTDAAYGNRRAKGKKGITGDQGIV